MRRLPTWRRKSSRCFPFAIRKVNDSLYYLNEWRIDYPVYRFCTGDVDGDGQTDALVGVIKKTRFHREMGRRIFIFKQVDGLVRPLWLGSKLGGILEDFRFVSDAGNSGSSGKSGTPENSGVVRSLETTTDGKYVVAEYHWEGFGLAFSRFLVKNTNKKQALEYFNK